PSGVGGNEYYPTEAAYLDAVADALHEEDAAAACAASRRSGCGCTPATASTRDPACTTLRWPSTWTRGSRSGPGRSPSRPPTRGTSTCTTCSSRSSRRGTRCCCPGSSATPPTSWSTPTPSRTGSSGSPLVGRENVVASADCGFSSQATYRPEIHPQIVWAKFESLAEGARRATARLWR